MSTEESSRSGYTVIWLISCFLFISIAAGGGFLVMYMVLPESPSTSWLPLAGVTLVCLPWLFWFLTFFYRVVSRACGFRMVIGGVGVGVGDGGGGGGKGGDNANAGNSTREDLLSNDSMTTGGGGEGMVGNDHDDVVTPAVVVLSDQKDHNRSSSSCSHERKESSNDDIKQNCSSSSDSIASRESEVPLAYSMS